MPVAKHKVKPPRSYLPDLLGLRCLSRAPIFRLQVFSLETISPRPGSTPHVLVDVMLVKYPIKSDHLELLIPWTIGEG